MSTFLHESALPGGSVLQVTHGDLTLEKVDAIVNAANRYLQHGGGVAWAISRRGGESIQRESDAWIRKHGLVSHAHPAWTSGGRLAARYVIHAVGPAWGEGEEDAKLRKAVHGSLQVADELGVKSIAFPALSTGIFGFPKERAARIILSAIRTYFEQQTSQIQLVRVVLFDEETVAAFLKVWGESD
ncbi:MAG: macro domain-containing protein [Anaerolineales bacterium]